MLRPNRRVRLPRRTISVGNIAVGGVGKTPIVSALCKAAGDRGVIVLTRGYRGGLKGDAAVVLKNGKIVQAKGMAEVTQSLLHLDELSCCPCRILLH